jgi:hypothetical protein
VSFDHAGSCVIDADQGGNADYLDGVATAQTIPVGEGSQRVVFTSNTPAGAAVGTAAYTPSATGGGSDDPVTFSVDAATTNAACSISGGVVHFDHAGTCVIDATQAGNADYPDAATEKQIVVVGKRTPLLAWTTPPTIHYGAPLTGVQLDAKSSVAGSFQYQPAGGTALRPGKQTLVATFTPSDAADYVSGGSVSTQITVRFTRPCITTTIRSGLKVSRGQSICISAGGMVTGPVNVQAGAALWVSGGSVAGSLSSTGARAVTLCGTKVTGPVRISGSSGHVLVGGAHCARNTIDASVSIVRNTGGLSFSGNVIRGPVTITGNRGGFEYSGNTITGGAHVRGNS